MNNMIEIIEPIKRISASIEVPGDKSISHRAFIISSLAKGKSLIKGSSVCADVKSTMNVLGKLGVKFTENSEGIVVESPGINNFNKSDDTLYAGNSGTTVRLLTGILAGLPFDTMITGDESLVKRPMKRIIEPLTEMGANIESEHGYLPLKITGTALRPVSYTLKIASAQVKSCVLLAGINAEGKTSVTEPSSTRDHTERMLPQFGITVEKKGLTTSVTGPQCAEPADITVPGDISSAAFFLAAALILQNSKITVSNAGLNPGRTGFIEIMRKMGANISISDKTSACNEPAGSITALSSRLEGTDIGGRLIPASIDELPVIAVVATQAEGMTIIRDAEELRVKETDRIEAVAENLRAMCADVEVTEDGLIIHGKQQLKGAVLESYGDHRIAMAFSIAGLVASGKTVIKDAECVNISFPGFFSFLRKLTNE